MNVTIVDNVESTATNGSTACLAVAYRRAGASVALEYSAVACVGTFTLAVCEVRVYEQVRKYTTPSQHFHTSPN